MTARKFGLAVIGVVGASLACFFFVGACPPAVACVRPTVELGASIAVNGWMLGALVGIASVVWGFRTASLLRATEQGVRRLATKESPNRLRWAQDRTGARRLVCLEGDSNSAFCAGLRPSIFIGEGVADRLSEKELDAVLLHEMDHAIRGEPLRRAGRQAAADVFFFAPLVGWWAGRRMEQVELMADRAALRKVGSRAVAAALWTLGTSAPTGTAAFSGLAEQRVAQLLGDPTPLPRPPLRLIATSAAGLYLALQLVACIAAPFLSLT